MTKFFFFPLLLIAASATTQAGDFEFRLVVPVRQVPAGAPIFVSAELRNLSGHAIQVARGQGDGFDPRIFMVRTDGKYTAGCQLGTSRYHYSPGYYLDTLPAGWSTILTNELPCAGEPGEWVIHAEVSSRDVAGLQTTPSREQPSRKIDKHACWHGSIKSEEIHVIVEEPKGVDKQVYELFNHQPMSKHFESLMNYPESTYAAYAWLGTPCDQATTSGCYGKSDPHEILQLLRSRDSRYFNGRFKLDSNGQPLPDGKGSYIWISPEKVQQDQVDWGERIMRYHPDFPYLDEVRMRVAATYIVLRQETKALSYFQFVAQNGIHTGHRDAAKKYLVLLSSPVAGQ